MAIKHSKYRNTGVLFELLVRQTTSDLIKNQDSKAVKILKKYFTNTELGKEYTLYNTVVASPKLSEAKAEVMISTIVEQYKKLDHAKVEKLKYNLIKEIKSNYDLNEFFKTKVDTYKTYASLYTILESHHSKKVDVKQVLMNKINLLEHLSVKPISEAKAPESLLQEFMKEDKDIRLLAYKILVDKFNNKYKDFSDRQKAILKEYITNVSDTQNLRKYLNNEINGIKKELTALKENTKDQVTKIKLEEVIKFVKPLKEGHSIKDETITGILQYCDLIDELKKQN